VGILRELLHPPAHRGPLIAAGAVVLTVGVALEQVRVAPGVGVQLLVAGALAAVLLWLALQARREGGAPPAHQSVLAVCGLLALYVALLRLADVLGADLGGARLPAGAFLWTSAVEAGVAAYVSVRRRSAVAALIAAIALGVALLAGWRWLFEPGSVTPYRWLLLLMALAFALAHLPLRGVSQRHAEQMVNAAGLALLAIPVLQLIDGRFVFVTGLPTFWELVLAAGGFGLVAYAGADRAPGPAYLGALLLAVFVALETLVGADDTLEWWPLLLLLVGAVVMAIGLRPRTPLPPEPDAYHQDDLPLAARTDDVRVRVHRD
jgi:hypothetical protein